MANDTLTMDFEIVIDVNLTADDDGNPDNDFEIDLDLADNSDPWAPLHLEDTDTMDET